MRRFVNGQIHGAKKALRQSLERAEFYYEKDKLIQHGDVVDGFPEVFECVEELLIVKNLISLKGNHDDWLLQFLESDYHPANWNYGGKGTLVSYLAHAGKAGKYTASAHGFKTALVAADVPASHRKFFAQMLPYFIDSNNRCFLHAGFDRHLPFPCQREENYYWDRTLWADALSSTPPPSISGHFYTDRPFSEIFIGHTPTTNWETDQPMHALNILNLDTGAGYAGRLTIMNIDTKQIWQSDPVMELYDTNPRDPALPRAEQYKS